MANIGEVGESLQRLFAPEQPGDLEYAIGEVITRAVQVRNEAATILVGSRHPAALELHTELQGIIDDLGPLVQRAAHVRELQKDVTASWIGGTAVPDTAPIVSPQPEPAPPPAETAPPEILNPLIDYRHPAVQTQLDQPLDALFTPEKVGEQTSKIITTMLRKYGHETVRDMLAAGLQGISYGTLGQKHQKVLHEVIHKSCPKIPLTTVLAPTDLARFTRSIDEIPLQAVLPEYLTTTRKRVAITDVYDPVTRKLTPAGSTRFRVSAARREAQIRAFVDQYIAAQGAPEDDNPGQAQQ
jgi:hypothetical protein